MKSQLLFVQVCVLACCVLSISAELENADYVDTDLMAEETRYDSSYEHAPPPDYNYFPHFHDHHGYDYEPFESGLHTHINFDEIPRPHKHFNPFDIYFKQPHHVPVPPAYQPSKPPPYASQLPTSKPHRHRGKSTTTRVTTIKTTKPPRRTTSKSTTTTYSIEEIPTKSKLPITIATTKAPKRTTIATRASIKSTSRKPTEAPAVTTSTTTTEDPAYGIDIRFGS